MDGDKCSYRYKALIAMFVLSVLSLIMFGGAILYSVNINKDDIVLNRIVAAGLLLLMLKLIQARRHFRMFLPLLVNSRASPLVWKHLIHLQQVWA